MDDMKAVCRPMIANGVIDPLSALLPLRPDVFGKA